MAKVAEAIVGGIDVFMAWLSTTFGQNMESYCAIETADSPTTLVAHDGSLISIVHLQGVNQLVGAEEFERIRNGVLQSLQTSMSRSGTKVQMLFNYDKQGAAQDIADIFAPAHATSERLGLELKDLFDERIENLAKYCAKEDVFMVFWTTPASSTSEQSKRSQKDKMAMLKASKLPPFHDTQFFLAAIPELRESHDSYIKSFLENIRMLGIIADLLEVHDAVYEMRRTVDPEFTDISWRPELPGDKIPARAFKEGVDGSASDVLWPSLGRQIMPRDAENLDLRTVRIGDRIYSTIFISLFPKEIQRFMNLFGRVLQASIPWRISFFVESDGLASTSLKASLAAVLTVTSKANRLVSDAVNLLNHIELNTDDVVVKLRVSLATWAPADEIGLLRTRASQLAQAVEGWGTCDVAEVSGDAFGGVVSSMLAVSDTSEAPASLAPLSDEVYMMPLFRPVSSWTTGARLFRSPDGNPWPFQP